MELENDSIEILPTDCLRIITKYVIYDNLQCLALTSRRFRDIVIKLIAPLLGTPVKRYILPLLSYSNFNLDYNAYEIPTMLSVNLNRTSIVHFNVQFNTAFVKLFTDNFSNKCITHMLLHDAYHITYSIYKCRPNFLNLSDLVGTIHHVAELINYSMKTEHTKHKIQFYADGILSYEMRKLSSQKIDDKYLNIGKFIVCVANMYINLNCKIGTISIVDVGIKDVYDFGYIGTQIDFIVKLN